MLCASWFLRLDYSYTNRLTFSNTITEADHELVLRKERLLQEKGLNLGHYVRLDKIPETLFIVLRICAATDEELYFDNPTFAENPISFRNEIKILSDLKLLFTYKLNQIVGGSIAEEHNYLQQLANTPFLLLHEQRLRDMAVYRLGQKEIMHNALVTIEKMELDMCLSCNVQLSCYPTRLLDTTDRLNITGMDSWIQEKNQIKSSKLKVSLLQPKNSKPFETLVASQAIQVCLIQNTYL